MSDEKQDMFVQEATAPRWIGIVVVALAVVSLVALGAGWTASNRSKTLEQSLNKQSEQVGQQESALMQRIQKDEDTNAQLQGELSVVTDKMKLTEGELLRARRQAVVIKKEDAKQLADLQNSLNGQLATKASVDDMNKLGTDVGGVKTDLETTKNNLNMARGEFGTLIAKNHDEIEELRRLGQRDYYEFTINRKGQREKVGDMMVVLRGVNPKRNLYTVSLYVDDSRYDKKNRSVNEPIYFFTGTYNHAPLEFVVNHVAKNTISGYLSVPKTQPTQAQNSGS
jgi:membrane protein implicated in regulation of membrane protease activity